MGWLDRKRTILMETRGDKVKLPTDLSDTITIHRYATGRDAGALMAPACNMLRDYIIEWGAFNS